MIHRIRGAGLLVGDDGRLLLALERDLLTGIDFWIPPGGGIEAGDGSAMDCVRREMFEETGLVIDVQKLVYVREFVERSRGVHTLELFFQVTLIQGLIAVDTDRAGAPVGADLRRHVEWFGRDEVARLEVRPFELVDRFWLDYKGGFPSIEYLGAFTDEHVVGNDS